MSTVADLKGEIDLDPNPFIGGLRSAHNAWDNFHQGLGQGASSFGSVSTAAVAMGNVIADVAIKAVSAVKDMAVGVVEAGFAFNKMKETATIAFTNLLGSAGAAQKMLKDLFDFAARTPFKFEEVTQAAQKLKNVGFAATEIIPMLRAVGDAASASGKGAEGVDRITNALVQMKAKGKVSAEEVVQQLGEIVPAAQIIADKMNITTGEMFKRMSKGALDVDQTIKFLLEGIRERYGGMMEAQSKSFTGMLNTIQDYFSQIAGQVMQPLFELVRSGMEAIIGALPSIQQGITDLLGWFGTTFGGIRQVVSDAIQAIVGFYQSHKADFQGIVEHAGRLIGEWVNMWGGVVSQIKTSVGVILNELHQMGISNEDIWNAIVATIHAAINIITITIRSVTLIFTTVVKAIEGAWSYVFNYIVEPIQKAINWVRNNVPVIGGILNSIINKAGETYNAVIGMYKGIQSAVDKSPKIGDLAESVGVGPKNKASLEAAALSTGLGIHSNLAKGVKGGGGGGKGGEGKNELAEAARENLAIVNEWLKATGSSLNLSKRDWDSLATNIQQNMINQAKSFDIAKTSSKEFEAEMRGGLLTLYPQLGGAIAKYIKNLDESATITAQSMTKTSLTFIQNSKLIDSESKRAKSELEAADRKLTQATIKESEERTKVAAKELDNLIRIYNDLSRSIPPIFNAISDTIIGSMKKSGDSFTDFMQRAINIKGWAKDIFAVIDTIPGHFGDVANKVLSTLNQWTEFGNNVLSVLHRLNSNIPETVGQLFTKLKGAFSSGFSSLIGTIAQGVGSISAMLGGGSIIGGAQGGGKGFLQGALGGGLFGLGANMGLMQILGLAGIGTGPLGWAIMGGGALIGGLIGLFKKKSPEQVKAEQEAKKMGEMNMQSVINSVNQGVIETMQKGAQLLEQISGFTDLPRKQIRRFVNQLTLIMTEFVDAMKDFKLESATHAKAISENLGAGFELMLGGAQLIEAIRAVGELSDEKIKAFIDTTIKIIDKWLEAVSTIELHAAKFAGKISEKLKPSIEVMGMIPDLIRAMIDASTLEITDDQLNVPFAIAKRIIDKFFELAEQFREYALKKTVKTAEQFRSLFESTKTIFEALKIIGEYQPLPSTIFDGLNADFDRITNWLTQSIEKVTTWLTLTDSLRDVVMAFVNEITGIGGALSGAFGGSVSQNITLQPTTASSAFSAPSSGGFAAAGSQQTVLNLNLYGSVIMETELDRKIAEINERLNRRWL